MDSRQYMIVNLKKTAAEERFLTEQVRTIEKSGEGLWKVTFKTGKVYRYNRDNLLFLTHPKVIDLSQDRLYIHDECMSYVRKALEFSDGTHTFYRLTYNNGKTHCLDDTDIYTCSLSNHQKHGSVWDYLQALAIETGLKNEDQENLLSRQYDLIDPSRKDVPLKQYLGATIPLKQYSTPDVVYYPFGCNASQKKAVEAALTHQVSIIQGPPGTGKTQTILNIIANLLIAGKNVLVVSSNNSAVENIAKKLEDKKLDFLVAHLGNSTNKSAFVSKQTPQCPDLTDWEIQGRSAINEVEKTSKTALEEVSIGFDGLEESALLRAEYESLMTEKMHNSHISMTLPETDWLELKPSKKVMKLLVQIRHLIEQGKGVNFWFKLKKIWTLGGGIISLKEKDLSKIVTSIESHYYSSRQRELQGRLQEISRQLDKICLPKSVDTLISSSLKILRHRVAKKYSNQWRETFAHADLKKNSEDFLQAYPIVLSTTYSAKSNLSKDCIFDYVIMDEASQVDIKTGAIALSCAHNAIIVGDDKQLPNVVTQEEEKIIQNIFSQSSISERYNAATHSFLKSCTEVFSDAPSTLLREHYRCHPKIIEFCNQKFYDGELIVMTSTSDQETPLQVVLTPKGNHATSEHLNQREIDIIVREIMPKVALDDSVGIITPYRAQANAINEALGGVQIADTIHKYQGQECDTIIISMVDNNPSDFVDDPNLLNVAISRAKKHLCIVTSGNELPRHSNIAQLIEYIRYNNGDIRESRLRSIFDLLYKQYTTERLAYLKSKPKVSRYESENILYHKLVEAIQAAQIPHLSIICHYLLCNLIPQNTTLEDEEKRFVDSQLSHIDFLLYHTLTKRPILAIEVDGYSYHNNAEQQKRDRIKDQILHKLGLPLHRLSTKDSITEETLVRLLLREATP